MAGKCIAEVLNLVSSLHARRKEAGEGCQERSHQTDCKCGSLYWAYGYVHRPHYFLVLQHGILPGHTVDWFEDVCVQFFIHTHDTFELEHSRNLHVDPNETQDRAAQKAFESFVRA